MGVSRVFVSHATTDAEVVRKLRERLEPHDVDLWVDRRELAPGDVLDPEIRAAIEDSDHFIVVLSAAALESAWVKKEVDFAREVRGRRDGFRLVPVLLPPLNPKTVSWILGEDVKAIPLGDDAGALDQAVAEILVSIGFRLREDASTGGATQAVLHPLDDLVLRLSEPEIRELDGTRRATARAQLIFRSGDPAKRPVESDLFRFVAPLGPIEADDLKWYLERYSAWPSKHFQERARRVEALLPEWGKNLYAALAPGKAASVLEEWRRSEAPSHRFSVRVDEKSLEGDGAGAKEGATLLLSLPWELVHDGRDYLFQGARGVRVRRQLPGRLSVPPLVTAAPIRVLLVSPRPEDESAGYIDHRVSARPLVEALEPLGELVELSVLRPPTYKALAAELARAHCVGKPYHVVHFDGHGIYDKELGLGALCFEDPDDEGKLEKRRTAIVQADEIAAVMRDHRVPLVFLEACQTAMSELDPSASVAGRLLDRGVASVAAMSHSVLVETARRFVGAFYESLMTGQRVGEAMLAGQRELANDTKRGRGFAGDFHLQDWFVPVLYQEELDPQLVTAVPSERVQQVVAEGRERLLGKVPEEPTHHFVGRSRELLAVERLLERERYAIVLGEGGEGKTTLAAELVRWLVATRRFARAAFVSVEHALDLRSLLFALGDQLDSGFVADVSKEPEKAMPLVERALRERPTVVVLDNMESVLPPNEGSEVALEHAYEPELLDGILQLCERLRGIGDTRIVLTSREAVPAPFDRNVVRIGRLDRVDAVKLVGKVLGEEESVPQSGDAGESEGEIERLVDAVNCHARSLVLVAREVAAVGVRGATDRLDALMAAMAERYGDDRERSLFASVELSLRRLPEATRQRLSRLGVFHGGGQLGVIAQVLGLDTDKDEEIDLARKLVGVGLGEILAYGHLRLHPALGPLLRRELGEAELEDARRVWVGAMVALAEYLRQQQSQDIQLAATLTVLELPNLLGALELLQASAGAEEVVGVATTIEGLLQGLGRSRAMARVVRVREVASAGLGGWSHGHYLAESAAVDRLLETGRSREAEQAARALLQHAAAAGEEAYEQAAYDLAMAYAKLGRALGMSGAADAALSPLAEARERFRRLGYDGYQTAGGMRSLCITEMGDCLLALGRLDEAARAYEEAIELDNARGAHRDVAVGKGQLGTVRMMQQRHDDALRAHTEALRTFERLGEPKSVAIAWHQIGKSLKNAGRYEAAEHAYQQSLRIKVQRGDRSGEANSLGELGNLYSSTNRLEDAASFYRRAAEIHVVMGDLFHEGTSRGNVAMVLVQLGRYNEARLELLRAIECSKHYGHVAQPWKIFTILHNLERASGNASAAASARDDAIAAFLAYRRSGGENHTTGAQLATVVGQAVTSGDTTGVAGQLAQFGARPDLPEGLQVLAHVLQQIVAGSRDPALVSTPGLTYDLAVEVTLLLERLG